MNRNIIEALGGRKISISLLWFVSMLFGISLLLLACSLKDAGKVVVSNTKKIIDYGVGDGGFLSEDTCGPPCFFDIYPGLTTKDEAINFLRANNLYQNCEEFNNTKESGVYAIGCDHLIVFLKTESNLVSGVGFQPTQPITVAEAIAKYGEPDVVSVAAIGSTNQQFVTGMAIYYDSIRAILGLPEQNSGRYEVTPVTLLATIRYLDREEYFLRRRYIQTWEGYGVYEQWNP